MSTQPAAAIPRLSPLSGKIGLWAHVTETLLGHLHDTKAAGFDYIAVKVADASAGAHTYHMAALQQLVKDASAIGLPVVAWAYVVPTNISAQISAIIQALPAGCNDLILDAEIEFEDAAAPGGALGPATTILHIHELANSLQGARKGLRLHLSSFWSTKLHATLPFRAFAMHCVSLQPQCYIGKGSRPAHEILDLSLTEYLSIVAKGKNEIIPTVNDPSFVPLLKAKKYPHWNVYAWDPNDGDAEVESHLAAWTAAIKAFRA